MTTTTIGRETAAARAMPAVEVPTMAEATAAAHNGPLNDKVGADGLGPERRFVFDHVDKRGRRWVGEFTAKVLTVGDTIALGLLKARLTGGVPLSHLDADTQFLLEVVAHLQTALVTRPAWAEDLRGLYESGVLGALYEEVAAHDGRFRVTKPGKAGTLDGDGA